MHTHNLNNPSSVSLIDSKTLINTSKGWDLRIFRDEHIARKLLCQICQKVCRNAQELSCSSAHLFCQSCIADYFSSTSQKTCPLDNEINVNYQPSRFVSRHISELYVFCPRSKHVCSKLMKHGSSLNNSRNLFCSFEGTLQTLIKHVSQQCVFNVISCPFHLIGCPTNKIYRHQLQQHISAAQNKHISLSLQKIQTLQKQLQMKDDTNQRLEEQLLAIKNISKSKNMNISQMQQKVSHLSGSNVQFSAENVRLKGQLKNTQKRLVQFEKAVHLLKNNNTKLAQEIDEIHSRNELKMNAHPFSSYNNRGGQSSYLEQPEVISQFESLLALQRDSNINGGNSFNSIGSGSGSIDDKQPNSTDVVCAFLKTHPELVNKLKMSNQIMYANIITDDKYASQFLKKMLECGNIQYRNEISQIVQKLQIS